MKTGKIKALTAVVALALPGAVMAAGGDYGKAGEGSKDEQAGMERAPQSEEQVSQSAQQSEKERQELQAHLQKLQGNLEQIDQAEDQQQKQQLMQAHVKELQNHISMVNEAIGQEDQDGQRTAAMEPQQITEHLAQVNDVLENTVQKFDELSQPAQAS